MKYVTWNYNEPGISFSKSEGRINIFKTTLNALRYPSYFRFLFDKDNKKFAVECCDYESAGSHQLPEEIPKDHYNIKSMDMVRFIYQTCNWDIKMTYRIKGIAVPEQKMVVFDLNEALKVREGRLIEGKSLEE